MNACGITNAVGVKPGRERHGLGEGIMWLQVEEWKGTLADIRLDFEIYVRFSPIYHESGKKPSLDSQRELAVIAKADIRGQAKWLRENVSPGAAMKWLDGLYKVIDTLQNRPMRCPVAAENDQFPEEIHEMVYGKRGKRKHKHRIIFTVREETVYVLYVRPSHRPRRTGALTDRPIASRGKSSLRIRHSRIVDCMQPLLIVLRHRLLHRDVGPY